MYCNILTITIWVVNKKVNNSPIIQHIHSAAEGVLLYIHQKYRKAPNVNTTRSFNKHFFVVLHIYYFRIFIINHKCWKTRLETRKNCLKKLQPVQRKEREKTLLLAWNIKIVQDLQGAMRPLWRCHGNLLLENRYLCFNHRRCAAIPFFFFPIEGRLWGS